MINPSPPRRRRALVAAALAGVLLSAAGCQDIICLADPDEEHLCEDKIDTLDENLQVGEPVLYATGVAYRVRAADRVTLLQTDGGSATVAQVSVPDRPTLVRARPSSDEALDKRDLLVLSEEDQSLTVIDTSDRSTRAFDLGSPFTTLSVSGDGRYAVAWYAPGSSSNTIVQNIAEMAIVDLDAAPAEGVNPQVITLRTAESRPQWIAFAPPFTLRGQTRRVALVMSANYANLIELDNPFPEDPGVNETVIRFVQSAAGLTLTPRDVVWTEEPDDDDDMFAFILASGSDDIISLNLLPSEELDAQQRPKIRPSLNQLTAGTNPVAMALYELGGDKKLLSVNRGSRDIAVIDVATSDTSFVSYDGTFNSVVVFNAVNRDTGEEEPHAMLYDGSAGLRTVNFVELASVETRGTRAINSRVLPASIRRLDMTNEGGKPRAVVLHPDMRSFSILDLERQAVAPLQVSSPITDYTIVQDGQAVITTFQSSEYIALTDLKSAHSTPVRLDSPGQRVFYVPQTNTVLVDHDRDLGHVTLMPFSSPTRSDARTLLGFGADGFLSIRE